MASSSYAPSRETQVNHIDRVEVSMTRTLPGRMYALAAVFVLTVALCRPVPTVAQVSTGSIVGTVLDSTGQLVPSFHLTVAQAL